MTQKSLDPCRDLLPIFARERIAKCGSCGDEIYWTWEPFGGRYVAVSIVGHGTIAPTASEKGYGCLHVCPPSLERLNDKRRESSPL